MAIIILKNKDSKIVDALSLFNPDAGLPKPVQQRKRDRKFKNKVPAGKEVEEGSSASELSETPENYLVLTNPYFYRLSKRAKV